MSENPLINAREGGMVALPQETQFAPHGIVSRTLVRTPQLRVVLFGFAAGQELSEHTSPHHALVQILSGECQFTLAGQSRRLKAGDLLYMPPGQPHAVRATAEFSMLLTLAPLPAGATGTGN